jgi:hypothetical protein
MHQIADIEPDLQATSSKRKRSVRGGVASCAIESDTCQGFGAHAAILGRKDILCKAEGPHSLQDVLSLRFVTDAADQRAQTAGVDLRRQRTETLGQTTYITTSYSGIGTAEAAIAEVARQFSLTGPGVSFHMHGSVERDAKCLETLRLHRSSSRPAHIFQDVLDRIPEEVAKQLQQRAAALRRKVGLLVQRACQTTGTQDIEKTRAKHVNELGSKFLRHAKQKLGQLDWSACNASWCIVHGQSCSLRPAASPGDLWIELAGSTCVAWSTMGAGWGWLDPSTVPCLTWAFWAARAGPDGIIHENVRPFDWQFFNDPDIFGERFWIASMCHSPVDLGVPANRPRRYTALLSRSLALPPQKVPKSVIQADTQWSEINPLCAT